MTIVTRDARPDDAPFLAWVMLAASRSHLSYGLWEHFVGGTERDCLRFLEKIALTKLPHLFHYVTFMVAEEDGKPVAGLSGYDPKDLGMMAFAQALPEVFEEIEWSKVDRKAAFERMKSYRACIPDDAPDAWIIESVAAVPEVRRRGIVSMLLHEMILKGKGRGLKRAQISVFIGNKAARGAYEKCGFRFVGEKRIPEFEAVYGDPGTARLVLEFN